MQTENRIKQTMGLDFSTKYVVISPVRDEARFIEKTLESMIQQTVKPICWVLVDDGSTDNTCAIVQKYLKKNPWICLVNREDRGSRQRGRGVIEAFDYGLATLSTDYDYIVKLDGDVSFAPTYFEFLLKKFLIDPQLGIAGGGLHEKPDDKTWVLMTTKDHVRGCTKIYRRACFEAINGLAPSMGWDGIDEWKALAFGWKIQSFVDIKIYHYRYTGEATGFLKSFYEQGNGAYRMGYHPLYLIARGLWHMTDRPYVIGGIAMIWAYITAWICREEKLADRFVISYIQHTQLAKLVGLLRGKSVHD